MNRQPEPEKSELFRDIAMIVGITVGGAALSVANMVTWNVWVGILMLVFFVVVNSYSAYNLLRKYYYMGGADAIDWIREETYGNR